MRRKTSWQMPWILHRRVSRWHQPRLLKRLLKSQSLSKRRLHLSRQCLGLEPLSAACQRLRCGLEPLSAACQRRRRGLEPLSAACQRRQVRRLELCVRRRNQSHQATQASMAVPGRRGGDRCLVRTGRSSGLSCCPGCLIKRCLTKRCPNTSPRRRPASSGARPADSGRQRE